jgi:polar amino acid transport system substrate-binding protein
MKNIFYILIFSISLFANSFERVQSEGVLTVGVEILKPYSFENEDEEIVGFDIDLLKYIARDLGVELQIKKVYSDNKIDLLRDDSIDLISRMKKQHIEYYDEFDYTLSYLFDGKSFVVKSSKTINSLKSLRGKSIGIIDDEIDSFIIKNRFKDVEIKNYEDSYEALSNLEDEKVDTILSDYMWSLEKVREYDGYIRLTLDPIFLKPYGFLLKENQSDFKDALNIAIQNSVRDGTYDRVYKKWFGVRAKIVPVIWP